MIPAAANPNIPEGPTRRFGWIIVSAIFHGLLIAVLIRTMGGSPQSKQTPLEMMTATTASDRIERVVEEVRQHEAEEVSQKLQELHRVEEELAKLDEAKISDYKTLATELAKDAPAAVKEAESKAVEAQKKAVEAQSAADAALEKVNAAENEAAAAPDDAKLKAGEQIRDLQTQVAAAQDDALRAQRTASAAQADVAQALPFADASFKEAGTAQSAAIRAQADAKAAQDKAKDAQQDPVNELEKRARTRAEQLQPVAQKFADEEKKAATAGAEIAAAEAAFAAAKEKEADERRAVETALSSNDPAAAAAEASEKAAVADRESARKAIDLAKRIESAAQRTVESVKGELARKRKEESESRVEAANKQLEAQAAQSAAAPAQAKALELQARAEATAASITPAEQNANGAATSDAVGQAVAQTHVLPLRRDARQESLGSLYDDAAASETNAAQIFRELRAAETAALRRIPLDEARRVTDMVQPLRNPIDKDLLAKRIRTPEDARDHAKAVRAAVQEIDSMVSLAHDLVREAKADVNQGATITLESIKAEATRNSELEKEAAQDYGEQAKDLSGIMRSMEHGKTEEDAAGGALRGALAGLLSVATAQGDAAAMAQLLSALAAMEHREGGAGAKSGGALAAGGQKSGGSGPPNIRPGNGHSLPAVPGRKVVKGAQSSDWMFVDSWWIIGPFPNPDRRNIEEKFPPESVIDLDASYGGKDNRKIRWQFVQSAHAQIWPPDDEEYQIYYAYTELWFDEACDRWIAVGSDDYSKIWLEGMLVWKSGDQLKGWNIDEGYRKVHFKKGLNRVLYRVENGWHSTQFSLCICLKDDGG